METKFTKGPWSVKPIEDGVDYIRIRGSQPGSRFKIANVIDANYYAEENIHIYKEEKKEAIANAHLIAASPDMYKALTDITEMYVSMINSGDCGNWNPEKDEEVIAARKALAKARGESNE